MHHLLLAALLLGGFTGNAPALQDAVMELKDLTSQLERHGFKIIYQHPPIRSAYGLFISKTKTIFISPLAFELGIGKQVLLHEATHAAQSCPSGTLSPIGWKIKVPDLIQNEISSLLFNSYKSISKSLEQEALGIQGHPNGIALIRKALIQRCPNATRSRR